ncbi:MAG: hypothetical protein ABEK50_01755 [bacterium]
MSNDQDPIGKVTDYFWKRNTVRIEVTDGSIQEGQQLHIKGEHTDVTLTTEDMEVDDEPVDEATAGEIFAMPISPQNRVVLGDKVFPADS